MANTTTGVKAYTESPTLLQYQPKKEVTQEDLIFLSPKKRQLPAIESNPSIPDALNAIFPPIISEENGKRYAYVYVPFKEYYCNTTDTVIKEFIANGYGCERTTDELNDDAIKVSW